MTKSTPSPFEEACDVLKLYSHPLNWRKEDSFLLTVDRGERARRFLKRYEHLSSPVKEIPHVQKEEKEKSA